MGRLRRVLKWIGITLVVVLIAGAIFAVWTVRRSFPTTAGNLEVPILDQPVTVLRDDGPVLGDGRAAARHRRPAL